MSRPLVGDPFHEFGAEILGGDLGLFVEDPVMVVPEGGRVLRKTQRPAMEADSGPGVDLVEGEVLEVEADFFGIGLEQIGSLSILASLAAVAALEIAEGDDDDRGAGGAEAGLEIGLDLGEVRGEGLFSMS